MAAHENGRASLTSHRSAESQQTPKFRRAYPGLAFARVFSAAGIASVDNVQWERRDLSQRMAAVEVPAEWSTGGALHFLQTRERSGTVAGGVRAEMERLLAELRAASLEAGYFAHAVDAALFVEEIGALLLSGRIVLGRASPSERAETDTSSLPITWHSDPGDDVLLQIDGMRSEAPDEDAICRMMALDDPDLAAVLAGRGDASSKSARLLLVLPDDLLSAAENDGRRGSEEDSETRHSGASDLLTCIAEAVLRRGKLDLLFRKTVERAEAFATHEAGEMERTLAGAATIDLRRLLTHEGCLDLDGMRTAAALLVTALEICIDPQTFAGEAAAMRAYTERRLAIGLSNVEDVLIAGGVDPDSAEAHCIAACMMALVSGEGLWQSARIAERCPALPASASSDRNRRAQGMEDGAETHHQQGGCPAFQTHADEVLGWMRTQRAAAYRVGDLVPADEELTRLREGSARAPLVQQIPEMIAAVRRVWDGALLQAERSGLRHLGVTGAGKNGFSPARLTEGANGRVAVFPGVSVSTQIGLMAAAQPFVHALTPWRVMLPEELLPEQLRDVVLDAWRCGLKGISVEQRRSGCTMLDVNVNGESERAMEKRMEATPMSPGAKETSATEPASTWAPGEKETHVAETRVGADAAAGTAMLLRTTTLADAERAAMERGHAMLVETQLDRISELEGQLKEVQAKARESGEAYDAKEPPRAMRHRLPAERASVTHKFSIAGHEGYITVGLYPNGSPGEIFLRMTKEGSAVAGLLDSFATAVSLALQHGVPVRLLAQQFAETRFEPSGGTANEQIPYALSIMDYLFRWIELRFLSGHQMDLFANLSPTPMGSDAVRVTGTVSGPKSSVCRTSLECDRRGTDPSPLCDPLRGLLEGTTKRREHEAAR